MALYPIFSGAERHALGVFKAHSTDYAPSSEGGLVVQLKAEGTALTVANHTTGAATAKNQFGLLDEQATSSKETMLGKFLPANSTPVVLGPATYLNSKRVSVWLESGWFLTDNYTLTVDGYGEATIAPNTALTVAAGGQLGVGGSASRCWFMQMVDDTSDLFASRVSPAPLTGMFAEKAPILIYQA
jgi:hypothetical protein